MKMTRLAWFLLGLLLTLSGAGLASGVSGFPFNPVFGAINAVSESLSGASSAASYTASGTVQGATVTSTGASTARTYAASATTAPQISITSGGGLGLWAVGSQETILPVNGALTVASSGTNCLKLGSAGGTLSLLLPCSNALGPNNFIPTLNAAQATKSGQFYAFFINNNGTTCAPFANSPGFPTGWSAARTSAGVCTFTFPAIAQTNNMIVTVMPAGGAAIMCVESANTTTTFAIKCFNTSGSAADTSIFVMFQDWN